MMTSDELADKAISLLLMLREAEIINAMRRDKVPYDETTAAAILSVGVAMIRHFDKDLLKTETLFLGLASTMSAERKLKEAELNKETE